MFIKVNCRGVEHLVNILHIERIRTSIQVGSTTKTCIHLTSGKPEFLECSESIDELNKKIAGTMTSDSPLI